MDIFKFLMLISVWFMIVMDISSTISILKYKKHLDVLQQRLDAIENIDKINK